MGTLGNKLNQPRPTAVQSARNKMPIAMGNNGGLGGRAIGHAGATQPEGMKPKVVKKAPKHDAAPTKGSISQKIGQGGPNVASYDAKYKDIADKGSDVQKDEAIADLREKSGKNPAPPMKKPTPGPAERLRKMGEEPLPQMRRHQLEKQEKEATSDDAEPAYDASCYDGKGKVGKVMGEFKRGDLHSGSKKGPQVKDRKQGIAIALSEGRKAGEKV